MVKDAPESDGLKTQLIQQMEFYDQMRDEDETECMWNQVNLSDPENLTEYLVRRAMNEGHFTEFVHILACLATIPYNKYE